MMCAKIADLDEVYVIDSVDKSTNIKVDVSGWNPSIAGTSTFPNLAYSAATDATATSRKFCKYCGHPLVHGKILDIEYNSATGLMFGRKSLFGCERIRWHLNHPRITKFLFRLKRLPRHELYVVAEQFDEETEKWGHWSNVSLKYWVHNNDADIW